MLWEEVRLMAIAFGMEPWMRIGIDFDNTVAGYDGVFLELAKRHGLVESAFHGGKQALRNAIRLTPDGEMAWQHLQGRVYGTCMPRASLLEGVDMFLRRCRGMGENIFIISHKTEFGHFDPERVNLRKAALDWMSARGFFSANGYGIPVENVYFEANRNEKLARIATLACTHFIDDLEEVLSDPHFPAGVTRILFAQMRLGIAAETIHCKTWREIGEVVFGERD